MAAAISIAGVHIENVTRDITTKVAEGAPQIMQVQDGKIRASRGTDGGMIIKGTTIYMIDDKRKQYREMDKESMKKMAGQASDVMAQMQERMKNMTPEQRAMMEKMMGGKMPGGMAGDGKPDVYESKDTGKNDTVEGRKCRVWHINRNGRAARRNVRGAVLLVAGQGGFRESRSRSWPMRSPISRARCRTSTRL